MSRQTGGRRPLPVTRYGTVVSFDRDRRIGLLRPDLEGPPIAFKCSDRGDAASDPRLFQRYSYEVVAAADGGQPRATNLRHQQTHREQAEAQRG